MRSGRRRAAEFDLLHRSVERATKLGILSLALARWGVAGGEFAGGASFTERCAAATWAGHWLVHDRSIVRASARERSVSGVAGVASGVGHGRGFGCERSVQAARMARGAACSGLWETFVFALPLALADFLLRRLHAAARPSVVEMGWKIILSGVATWLSYRWIERPCRTWLNQPSRRSWAYGLVILTLLGLVPLGFEIRRAHYLDASDAVNGELVLNLSDPRGTLMLMGDSQAGMYAPMLRDLALARQWRFLVLSVAGDDPLETRSEAPETLWQRNLAAVRREHPTCLVLTCHWIYKLSADPQRLTRTLTALQPLVGRIVLLTQPPLLPLDALRSAMRRGSRPPYFEAREDRKTRQQLNTVVLQAAGGNVSVIDTEPLFTTNQGAILLTDPSGRPLFQDRVHLSGVSAERVKLELEAALQEE